MNRALTTRKDSRVIELDRAVVTLREDTVFAGVTATMHSGTVTHLAGTSRPGRATLLAAIAGLERHTGAIRFDGRPVGDARSDLYACFAGAPLVPSLTGYENLRLLAGRSLAKSELAAVAPAVADDSILRAEARWLTRGQRKRVHLVAALAAGARYLLFDELLAGDDAPTPAEVSAALDDRSPHATVLLAGPEASAYRELCTHRLDLVPLVTPE